MTSDIGSGELSKAQLRSTRHLLSRKGRQSTGHFLVEGPQAVREALQYARVHRVIVERDSTHDDLLALAGEIPVNTVGADGARQLSDTVTPQGIWAVADDVTVGLDAVTDQPRLVVICAQVRDPGNAGTIIRCADAFGADAVVFTEGSVEPTNPKTVRSTVGSVFHLPIITKIAYEDAVRWARDAGLSVLATDAAGRDLDQMSIDGLLAQPTAWVMGNEAWGLPAQLLDATDEVVRIPMWGKAESLNLSTAAAICLYASATSQRRALR